MIGRNEASPRLGETIARIAPLDAGTMSAAGKRHDQLTKPPGSLGRLEALSVQLAGITGQPRPRLRKPVIITMAALFHDGFGRWQLVVAIVWAALGAVGLSWRGPVAFVMAFGMVLVFAQLGRNRLGGMNGEVYGAIGEVVEVVIRVLGSLAG